MCIRDRFQECEVSEEYYAVGTARYKKDPARQVGKVKQEMTATLPDRDLSEGKHKDRRMWRPEEGLRLHWQ